MEGEGEGQREGVRDFDSTGVIGLKFTQRQSDLENRVTQYLIWRLNCLFASEKTIRFLVVYFSDCVFLANI